MQIPKPNLSSIKAKLDDVQLSDVKTKKSSQNSNRTRNPLQKPR